MSKRSYINEDMNFRILKNFYGFYFDFSSIFRIYFLIKKSQKGFIILRKTHEVDVAWRGHVAKPREPTWTHVDAYMEQGAIGLAFDGPWV